MRLRPRTRAAAVAAGLLGGAVLPAAGLGGAAGAIVAGAAVLAAVGAVLLALADRLRAIDRETGLPTLAALADAMPAGDVAVAVARIEPLASAMATDAAPLARRIAERLRLGTGGGAVYRVAPQVMAWIVDPADVERIDERLAALAAVLRAPVRIEGRPIELTVSFGVADGEGGDALALIAAARAAATRAHGERKRWARAIADELDRSDWKAALADELDAAIASGALWVAYQPKVDVASGRVIGAEALARWQHPRRGALPPDLFVPLIERAGRAAALTAHVLETALADAASWRRIGRPVGVAVNVSAILLGDERLVPEVAAALARHRMPPAMLTLEVTEHAAVASADAAIMQLQDLRELGVRVSIDDYGTGQSTMTYLKRFPATELKIDKSFVQGLTDSRADMILVRSTIDLAHALGMSVVAEGVETEPCLDLLRMLGCDTVQGWHTGKPMPAESLSLMQAWQRAA